MIGRRGFIKAIAASSAASVIPAIGLSAEGISNFKYYERLDESRAFAYRCMITFEYGGVLYDQQHLIDKDQFNSKLERFNFVSKYWAQTLQAQIKRSA